MADQDVKDSHEKTVNLEALWSALQQNKLQDKLFSIFNFLMDIPVNGRNQVQETQLASRALNSCQNLWEVIFQ